MASTSDDDNLFINDWTNRRVASHHIARQRHDLPQPDGAPSSSTENVDKILAKELNSMSFKERDQVYEEVHGVHEVMEESPKFVQEKLTALKASLEAIRTKEAYDIAYQNCHGQYVTAPKFELMFLRAEGFDVVKASERIVRFHEEIRSYFGVGALGRSLTLEDLDKDDMVCLKGGINQRLPQRDSSGRAVICVFNVIVPPSHKSADSFIRATIYFLMALIFDDELSQKRGMVAIMYLTGASLLGQPVDEELWTKSPEILQWLPFRYTAFHLCANDFFTKALTPVVKLGIGRDYRARLRVHHGEHLECRYSLMSFGIPMDCFPLSYDGKVKLKDHHKFIAKQRVREDALQIRGSFSGVDLPGDKDILLGRGKAIYNHKGNVWMRHLVAENYDLFDDAKYGEKAEITSQLVAIMKDKGGHFLKLMPDGWWVDADDKLAEDKVSHAFRTARMEKNSSLQAKIASKTATGAIKKART